MIPTKTLYEFVEPTVLWPGSGDVRRLTFYEHDQKGLRLASVFTGFASDPKTDIRVFSFPAGIVLIGMEEPYAIPIH